MTLDVRTLALMLALMSLAGACVLFFFYRLLPREQGLKNAWIGSASQALASILLVGRNLIPDWLSIAGNNIFYFLAYAFLYQTTREFVNKPTDWRRPGIIIVLLMIPILLLSGDENIGSRIILNAVGIGVLTLMASWTLLKQGALWLPGQKTVAFALLSISALCLFRIIKILLYPPGSVSFFQVGDEQIVFLWSTIAVFIYVVAVVVLTSERLRFEMTQQLAWVAQSREVADNALREQKNFVTMLSHEFRTPLGIIKANTDAIRALDAIPNKATEKGIARIEKANLRLTSLVNGCLNEEWLSSSLSRGNVHHEVVDISELLVNLCSEYDVRFDNISSTDRPVTIATDRYLITILFSSLLDNAVKYTTTPQGVSVVLRADTDSITVDVTDDGAGIPESEQEKIFEKFYRIRNGNQRPGSGLGLYFVKVITARHKGTISVACTNGTRITITLPRLREI